MANITPAPEVANTPNRLPKLEDLYSDPELAYRQNELNRLLNSAPKKEWIKFHPMLTIKDPTSGQKVPLKYMAIGTVEYLLTAIFQRWKVEVLNVQQLANSVVVSVRLHYQDPLTMEWLSQDGVGATDIQTRSGASAADFAQIVPAALQKAVPAAKSYAVKDAAQTLGRIFGKDLNRTEEVEYRALESKFSDPRFENMKTTLNS